MSLHGRLAEYPLSVLLEIFLHKGETGLLEISSPSASGSFYLKDGELIDAALGNLRGAEAVRFGATLPDAYFQFRSLSPDEYLRRVWEGSFESSQEGLADISRTRTVVFHSALRQFSAYVSATHRTLKRVLILMGQRALSFTKAGGKFTWKAAANLAQVLMVQARALTKLLLALRQTTAEWLIALRDYEAPLRKQTAFKAATIWKTLVGIKNKSKAMISPALLERILPASRISLGIVIVALLVANLVFQIERRSNNDAIAADPVPATTAGNEPEAEPTRVRRHRSKRRSVSRGKRNPGVTQSSSTRRKVEASAVKQANTSGGQRSIGFRRIAY